MSAHSYARVHDGKNPVRISGNFLRLTLLLHQVPRAIEKERCALGWLNIQES